MKTKSLFAAAITFSMLAACSDAATTSVGTTATEIVGGQNENGLPSAGFLAYTADENAATSYSCSAVAIGTRLILTAAHCVTRAGAYAFGTGAANANPATLYSLRAFYTLDDL